MASSYSDSTMHHAWQELTSKDKRHAAAHLNETDEIRENAVAEIRSWMEDSDNLPARIDNFFILRFLRVCKFNLEETKVRIRNYYKQRSNLPEWYINKDPFRPELQELLDLGIVLSLRKPDSQGRLVFIVRATQQNPRIHKIQDVAKVCILMAEIAVKYYPAGSVHGFIVLVDTANITMRHIFQFQPYVLKNLIHAFHRCYPLRYQKTVIFNAPRFVSIFVMKIIATFMTEEMKSSFHVYSDALHCFEDAPANILPVEYGGTNGTLQELTDYWKKFIEENSDWLTKDENDQI